MSKPTIQGTTDGGRDAGGSGARPGSCSSSKSAMSCITDPRGEGDCMRSSCMRSTGLRWVVASVEEAENAETISRRAHRELESLVRRWVAGLRPAHGSRAARLSIHAARSAAHRLADCSLGCAAFASALCGLCVKLSLCSLRPPVRQRECHAAENEGGAERGPQRRALVEKDEAEEQRDGGCEDADEAEAGDAPGLQQGEVYEEGDDAAGERQVGDRAPRTGAARQGIAVAVDERCHEERGRADNHRRCVECRGMQHGAMAPCCI